ncbi:MAG: fused MFS/spermidine synthase [Acidobacteria bacterium]|nr:fused MFS/spermidine synthase [Acidobacteriota bacterium]
MLYLLFFLSGFPALIYQIVWQRALFTIFGVNVESVTLVVSAFMLGLGLGSLSGGAISKRPHAPILKLFGGMELGIAAFGLISLPLFQWVATHMAGAPPAQTFLLTFALVLIPTILMGATLPLLVTHLVRQSGHVGRSVGILYFVNTLGSAVACFVAAFYTMRALGMSGSVYMAAAMNVVVGISVLFLDRDAVMPSAPAEAHDAPTINFPIAVIAAGITGFISLGYEIVWYRVYSFITGGSPKSFSFVLGAFLAGIAFGSLAARKLRGHLIAPLILIANVLAFLSIPLIAYAVRHVSYELTLPLIALAAGLLGATFPLISHAAIDPAKPGTGLSYLYLANIIGSALGSYLMGFVLMDIWGLRNIVYFLFWLGMFAAMIIRRRGIVAVALLLIGVFAVYPRYDTIYERLMYKDEFTPEDRFTDIVETHSGVVTVDSEKHIYGGGAHDGILTTNLETADSCIRPFSLSYIHPNPKEVLLVGVAGGAWSQIVANHPQVERAIAIEINPGYLEVISRYKEVAPLRHNPKLKVVIDDGRRWMNAHCDQKFDAILMDTVQHWRANATNLLSVEMFTLARSMLKPGGVIYFNTTWSDDVQKTATTLFPHALRFGPFLAVSDSPLELSEPRWRHTLERYTLDGKPLRISVSRLNQISKYLQTTDETGNEHLATERAESIRRRTRPARIITDDNMAPEWAR